MRCSRCGSENPAGTKFCSECGTGLPRACPHCGVDNAPAAKFCNECGASLNAPLGPPVSETPRVQAREVGERRHLTVLFCDLVGSTAIAAKLDPEEWRETVGGFQRAAAEAVTRFGGHVAKYLGDGVMAYFGWPAAHDNDAERAVRAGLAILDAIAKLNEQPAHAKLAARIGIDSGTVVIGKGAGNEAEIFGDVPNIAARVEETAEPGTVAITGATQRLISGLFVVEDRGAQVLKGIERPLQLCRVIRPSGVRGRFEAATAAGGLTSFVGREDELRALMHRWERALAGEGQVALIIGEGGIGKSRLVQRFHEQIAGTPHTWVAAGAGAFFQNTPFYPVTEMLRQLVWAQNFDRLDDYLRELKEGEDGRKNALRVGEPIGQASEAESREPAYATSIGDEQLAQLQSGLMLAGLKPAEAIPLIAPFLNLPLSAKYPPLALSPEQQRRRLLATLVEWILGAARVRPLVIATEDLHWADPSTLELIQILVEQGATARLLLLYTARPEFRAPWPMRAHHTQITLNRLSVRDIRAMVAQVAASKALADDTVATVVERTGGVPLFVEELTRAVLESGDAKLTGREIPATLHDSLMARLDRLGSAKEVIQVGAVIGSEFSYELLHAVHPIAEAALQRALRSLADAELLYVRGIAPDATYQFKHALIRDAAYEALLKSRRKDLHRLVARTIDQKFPTLEEAHPEVLARHWTEAGEAEPAVAAWQKAVERAVAQRAFREVDQNCSAALAILRTMPESADRDRRELTLLLALGGAMGATRGYSSAEVGEVYARARILAERAGGAESLAVFFGLWGAAHTRGEQRAALARGDQLFESATGLGDPAALARAHYAQAVPRHHMGDLTGAQQHFAAALTRYREEDFIGSAFTVDPGLGSLLFGAQNEWTLGYPEIALRHMNDALALARRQNSPAAVAFALSINSGVHSLRNDFESVREVSDEAIRLAIESGFPQTNTTAKIWNSWARAQAGESVGAIERIRECLAEFDAQNFYLARAAFLRVLGETQMLIGTIDDALITAELALRTNPDELVWRPGVLRLRGELRLRADAEGEVHFDLAEQDFRDSIAMAQTMSAKAWELRATISLARLLRYTGRRDEARTMLAEIYGWFTEGFDTADLIDAKALLYEMAD
jgi:class 3 adenylate cyclase/tetratricopeptide (TPR) repeat protein